MIVGACARPDERKPLAPALPQISGTLTVPGLSAPVRVIRDRWGVPHIKAENQDDLFFAQGFVQAQDRLFQMDLWRKSVQGRLSEVLGANFVERDATTRRIQYRGDLEAEWASYGSDTRAIAAAFVRGVNAWIRLARDPFPEEFVLAGWAPELWRPEDLLNRTDAFMASGNAQDEVFHARLVAAAGAARAVAWLPPGHGPLIVPRGLDLGVVGAMVGDILRRVGTPPFFMGLAASPAVRRDLSSGSNAWAVAKSSTGSPLVAGDPHRPLEHPSPRYLVHLEAPGWNVIGATAPWLPGVAIGHNDHVAWTMTASSADTQDVFVEQLHPTDPRQVRDGDRWVDLGIEKDAISVKGRAEPLEYERLSTANGVVIAVDRERHLAFALGWAGAEPGAAAELGALAIDRARSASEFSAALAHWKMPAAEFVFADRDGHVGRQQAALTPRRRGWNGALPVPGQTRVYRWTGWTPNGQPPRRFDPPALVVVSANDSVPRMARILERLGGSDAKSREGFEQLQHDVVAWNAQQLVPLLERLRSDQADVEDGRQRLARWDRRLDAASAEAALYIKWEEALLRMLAARRVPAPLLNEYVARAGAVLVPAITKPSSVWFDGNVTLQRDTLLLQALTEAVGKAGAIRQGVTFAHPLAVTDLARRRFNVGPFAMPGYPETVFAMVVAGSGASIGPSFRVIMDPGDWDRSVATNAPGQSGSPDSPHFKDLAAPWAAGDYFPLSFSGRAVQDTARSTLTLLPP